MFVNLNNMFLPDPSALRQEEEATATTRASPDTTLTPFDTPHGGDTIYLASC
jgi:hypothetical protein